MMILKTLLITSILLLTNSSVQKEETQVYISTGPYAAVYHSRKTCRTIRRCNEEGHVRMISLDKAVKMGRRPCRVCCK